MDAIHIIIAQNKGVSHSIGKSSSSSAGTTMDCWTKGRSFPSASTMTAEAIASFIYSGKNIISCTVATRSVGLPNAKSQPNVSQGWLRVQ